jgi:hypothetical protein
MNPDGFALRRRGNANNVDLNRDFPDQVSTPLMHGLLKDSNSNLQYSFFVEPLIYIANAGSFSPTTMRLTTGNLKLELL